MKILHITPSLAGGGAERMISKICMEDNDNEHIIISLLNLEQHYYIKNAEIISLNLSNNNLNKILAFFKLYKLIKKIQPELIQTWMKANFYGPLLKKRFKIPIVSNFRNGYHGTKNKNIIKFYNKYFNEFDGHVFVSESAYQERIDKGMKFKNHIIINNGFKLPMAPSENKDGFIIGHVGRYHPIKQQQIIIDAYKEFCIDKVDTKLVLVGRDLKKPNINFDGIPSKKIEIYGEIKNLEKIYSNLNVFILTSLSEGFPNVIGEAMSYSVPVITTNAGESFKVVGETGFKLSAANKKEIIELFNYLYENKGLLIAKGKLARDRIEKKFTLKMTIDNYKKFYEMIGERK